MNADTARAAGATKLISGMKITKQNDIRAVEYTALFICTGAARENVCTGAAREKIYTGIARENVFTGGSEGKSC